MNFNLKLEKNFELKAGSHTIQVKFVPASDPVLNNAGPCNGSPDHGLYAPSEMTMYINRDDKFSMRLSTFFHEFFHVLEDTMQIKMSHKDINIVGEMLSGVIIDNFFKKKTPQKKAKKNDSKVRLPKGSNSGQKRRPHGKNR